MEAAQPSNNEVEREEKFFREKGGGGEARRPAKQKQRKTAAGVFLVCLRAGKRNECWHQRDTANAARVPMKGPSSHKFN